MHMEVESDSSALTRRIMLMEEEAMKAETNLANTVDAFFNNFKIYRIFTSAK